MDRGLTARLVERNRWTKKDKRTDRKIGIPKDRYMEKMKR
jgi:hypothetical protein